MFITRPLRWAGIMFFCLYESALAQIPAHLKNPYRDLLKLNNSGQYQAAILQGKILVAQEPMFPHAYGQLAFAFEKAEQVEQGLTYFDSLRQRSPDNPYVYYAIALLEKGQKNYEQALGNLKVCIKLNPKYERAYFQLVNVYDALDDLETPTNYFHSLLQEDSLNAAAYYGLGCIYKLKKEWAKGAEAFATSLELNSDLVHAYYLKGLMHANQRDYQRALETWDKGKEVAAWLNDIELQGMMTGNVGNAYHDMGQYQKAIPYREKALKLAREIGDKKQEERHLSNLGNSYKAIGQPTKAIELYDKGLAIARQIGDKKFEETLLGNKSAALVDKGEYDKGIKCGIAALKMAEARGDSHAVSSHCWNIGSAYSNKANYPEAVRYYQRALRIRRSENDLRGVCELLGNLGTVYKDMGEISTAIDTFQKALRIAREIPSKRHELFILGSLGYAYSGWSDYSRANRYFRRALALADSLGAVPMKGTYLGNIGVIYKKWGNFSKALDYLNQALHHDEKINNPRGVVRHYVNMANIYEIRGDYVQDLELEKKALAVSDSIGTRNYSAIILGNIGVAYDKIGDTEQALSYFERGLKLAREIPAREFESSILRNMGAVYEKIDKDSVALERFKESLQIAGVIGNKEDRAAALIAIGDIYVRGKEYSRALNYYNQTLTIAKKIGEKNQEGTLYLSIGNVHLEKGDLTTAMSLFQKALEIGKKMDAFDLIYESLSGIAAVKEKQEKYDEAVKYYKAAVDTIESVRERLHIEPYKIKFMESKFDVYESLIELLIRLKKFKEAYEKLQWFRARSFLEILSPERIDITRGISPERFEQYREAEGRLRAMYGRLAVEYKKIKRDQRLISALMDSLNQIRSEHENILDEIRLHHPAWAQLTGIAQPLRLEEIQSEVLPPKTSLLEYFVGPELTAIWVIKKDSFACEVIEIKRDSLVEMVKTLRQPFKDVKEHKIHNLADVGFNLKLAQRLYEQIFLPVEKYLHQGDQLIIVPDGVLHYLPFEALVTKRENKRHDNKVDFSRYENAHYLVGKYPISYIPAVSILGIKKRLQKPKQQKKGQLLAFGSPDFGAFAEIMPGREGQYPTVVTTIYRSSKGLVFSPLSSRDAIEISDVLQPASLFLGKEATEDHFKEEAGNFPNIYLSTHAIVSETQPMYSLIAFAQDEDPKEDGFLHTYEVFNLQLDADLVTLSACETGLGRLRRGEGLLGLTRAFLYAGASAVMVSLWSVEESSVMLMKDFYRNLKQGMPKAKALQQAKIKLIKTRQGRFSFAHPFLWAPFVLVGEWR